MVTCEVVFVEKAEEGVGVFDFDGAEVKKHANNIERDVHGRDYLERDRESEHGMKFKRRWSTCAHS